jgi:uncharacterized protein
MSAIDAPIDDDIRTHSREQLMEEVARLRQGIRLHRDSTGQELCWHHPALWGLLPERTDPLPAVPAWPEFLRGCVRYRQSLDEQAAAAPRTTEPYRSDSKGEAPDSQTEDAILWRRLDVPGHDACRLVRHDRGWRVEGAATFRDDDGPTWLAYGVECDLGWSAQRGWVRGYLGSRAIDCDISRVDGAWQVNGARIDGLHGLEKCVDLDLGFTPATNVIHIRRLALQQGQSGDVRSAWFDVPTGSLKPLDQRYERRTESAYWYEAPTFAYAAELDVAGSGFIRRYPALWAEDAET